LARTLEARGEIDAAVIEIRVAIDKEPGVIALREFLAALLIRHDHIADAEKEARENLKAFPGMGWPFMQLSLICEARGDMAQGLEYARKGYAMQSDKLSLAANLARFLRLVGNHDEHENFCMKAIDEDFRQGWAWRERCRMADARGNRSLALEMGMKALAVHPTDYEFKRYYDALHLDADKS
jgi:tetratricopeptide (TPR) repeat protein